MEIRPILSSLRQHRLATALITLEVACAFAVFCNACLIIANRVEFMQLASGIDESSLAIVDVTNINAADALDADARLMRGLRGIPGVHAVARITAVPFGSGAGVAGISLDSAGKHTVAYPSFYDGSRGTLRMLGVQLTAGRFPGSDDVGSGKGGIQRVLITRSLAEHLWPNSSALGRAFWYGRGQGEMRVIGVMKRLLREEPVQAGSPANGWSVFTPDPETPTDAYAVGKYLLRADPAQVAKVLLKARAVAAKLVPDATVDHQDSVTVAQLRRDYFSRDRAMVGMMLGVIAALLAVTALGIVGLTGFWVQQRRKQIGIRRALGATRADILRYFQTENFLIVTFGIVAGAILAVGLNLLLMQHYELARMPLWYLPVGAIVLWVLGQLAVLAPALRASNVPPVVATRSV